MPGKLGILRIEGQGRLFSLQTYEQAKADDFTAWVGRRERGSSSSDS